MTSPTSPPVTSGSDPRSASMGTSGNRSENAGESVWFIASYATNHMTGDRSLISNLVHVSDQVVQAGEGEGMLVCGKGSVQTETVVLPDMWYVPRLIVNLVLVGQLTDDPDLIVQTGGGMCRISKSDVLGIAYFRSDKKYAVDFLKIELN